MQWHLITGEYPPQIGGVAAHTHLLAIELARSGDDVHIWAPQCSQADEPEPGIVVNRLPGRFGVRGLRQLVTGIPRSGTILVQYVPHAFGMKAMNIPFCLFLRYSRHPVWVVFHEVATNDQLGFKYRVQNRVTELMSGIAASAAQRIFVTIPAWSALLGRIAPDSNPSVLPAFNNVPILRDAMKVQAARDQYIKNKAGLIGHFGTYRREGSDLLRDVLPLILRKCSDGQVLLIGSGSDLFLRDFEASSPEFKGRIHATGVLAEDSISASIQACDVMIQPYADGVTGRNGSVLAAMAHGKAVVANNGKHSETFWRESDAVRLASPAEFAEAVDELLRSDQDRLQLGLRSAKFYRQRFAIENTMAILRSPFTRCP